MPLSSTLWQGGSTLVGSLKDYYLGNKAGEWLMTPFLPSASRLASPFTCPIPRHPRLHPIDRLVTPNSLPDKPAITPQTALLNALLFTALYILPFYISPTLRATSLASRDDPTVIRARTRAVGLSSSLSTIITLHILHTYGQTTPSQTLHYLGLWPIDILDTAGKKHTLQRKDIAEVNASALSIMPTGFEQLPAHDLASILEYIATSGHIEAKK